MDVVGCIENNKKVVPQYQDSKSLDSWDLPRGKKLVSIFTLGDNVIYNGVFFKKGMRGFTLSNTPRFPNNLLAYFPIKKSRGLLLEFIPDSFKLIKYDEKPVNYDILDKEFRNKILFQHESAFYNDIISDKTKSIKRETGAENVYTKLVVCPDGRQAIMFSTVPVPKGVSLIDFVGGLLDNNIIACPCYSIGFYNENNKVTNIFYYEYYYDDLKFIDEE